MPALNHEWKGILHRFCTIYFMLWSVDKTEMYWPRIDRCISPNSFHKNVCSWIYVYASILISCPLSLFSPPPLTKFHPNHHPTSPSTINKQQWVHDRGAWWSATLLLLPLANRGTTVTQPPQCKVTSSSEAKLCGNQTPPVAERVRYRASCTQLKIWKCMKERKLSVVQKITESKWTIKAQERKNPRTTCEMKWAQRVQMFREHFWIWVRYWIFIPLLLFLSSRSLRCSTSFKKYDKWYEEQVLNIEFLERNNRTIKLCIQMKMSEKKYSK